jgi:hypothetical protein
MMRWCFAIAALGLTGCHQPVHIGERGDVRVIADSPSVRSTIREERERQVNERQQRTSAEWQKLIYAELFNGYVSPRRREFLARFSAQPGYEIERETNGEIIGKVDDCRCALKETTNSMVLVRITSGFSKIK